MAPVLHLYQLPCGQGVETRYPAAQLVRNAGNWGLRIGIRKSGLLEFHSLVFGSINCS